LVSHPFQSQTVFGIANSEARRQFSC
jgi:hypothetical protein